MKPESKHAKLSPSKLSRIIACPASANFVDEDTTSEAALLGTLKHEVIADLALKVADNRDKLDDDGVKQVNDAMKYVRKIRKSLGKIEKHEIEQRVSLETLGLVDVFGTADVLLKAKSGELAVIDYKFGRYKVNAENNPQLMAYAAGAICRYGTPDSTMVNMFIIQPTINNYQRFALPAHALLAWVENTLKVSCIGDHSNNFNPSDSACKFCPNRFNCSALFTQQAETAERVFEQYKTSADELKKDDLSGLLKKVKSLEKYIKDLKVYVLEELSKGELFNGLELKPSRSKRVWKDEKKVVRLLEEKGLQPYTVKVKSPYQLYKDNPKLKKDGELNKYLKTISGKQVIMFSDSKDKNSEAESVFKGFAK